MSNKEKNTKKENTEGLDETKFNLAYSNAKDIMYGYDLDEKKGGVVLKQRGEYSQEYPNNAGAAFKKLISSSRKYRLNEKIFTIYGAYGFNRWHVYGDGIVKFSAIHCKSVDIIKKAYGLGFTVVE